MNNKKTLFSVVILSTMAAGIYWYSVNQTSATSELPVLRKASQVTTASREALKNRDITPCPKEKLYSLRLTRNQKLVWKKTVDESLQTNGAIAVDSRRLKADRQILPVRELISDDSTIQNVIFSDCQGDETSLSTEEILAGDTFFLGKNKKGWLKLMRLDEKGRYSTVVKAVTDIRLSTHQALP